MPEKKADKPAVSEALLPVRSFPELLAEFKDVIGEMMGEVYEEAEGQREIEVTDNAGQKLLDRLAPKENSPEALALRDRFVELLFAMDSEAARCRAFAAAATRRARNIENTRSAAADSVRTAMELTEVERVEGQVHRLALYKLPERLVVLGEANIPPEYFDRVITEERVLNKNRVTEALQSGEVVPGAFIEKGRKRLDVK